MKASLCFECERLGKERTGSLAVARDDYGDEIPEGSLVAHGSPVSSLLKLFLMGLGSANDGC